MYAHRRNQGWSRRAVLEVAAGLVGSVGLGTGVTAAIAGATDDGGAYSPFKMGLQSYSLRGLARGGRPDLRLALDATRELGIHYWESYTAHVPIKSDPDSVNAIKQELAGASVSIIGYGVVPLTKDEAANRPVFEFAKAMGLEYISADPAPDAFDCLDKLVAEFDIAVGIHNHGPGHRYAKIDTIAKAIERHHVKIGCCIDTGHFLRSKEDPVEAVAAFGKRVYGVHLKDVKDATTFTVLGGGDLRTVDFLKALNRNKYGYCLAIEYEEKPESPLDDLKACLAEAARAIAEVRKGS
jgi:sugar phosphate isomerase/epimerase